MSDEIEFDPKYHAKRWVSYLDLLGFTELTRTRGIIDIFSYYTRAIEHFTEEHGFKPDIDKTWFSDTFLLYTPDDSASSFAIIEATTRWFIYFLICDSEAKPVRGAMSCDDLYADKDRNIFFGKALVEAYHYGENQDWIGFVLSPSAIKQLDKVCLPASERLNYAYWDIPYKLCDKELQKRLPACIIGNWTEINGKNPCLDKIENVKIQQTDPGIAIKYTNTISFLKANTRRLVT